MAKLITSMKMKKQKRSRSTRAKDDEQDAFSAPTHRKKNKTKKPTKMDAESLAIELLYGRLKPLNQPNDMNWLDIVPILDSIFKLQGT